MISSSYLVAIHAIRTRHSLPDVSCFSLAGNFDAALACAMAATGRPGDTLSQASLWQDIGDIHILKGEFEAAEASYEKSVGLLGGHPLLGAMSCRAAGIQMLAQGRLETATRCFLKNLRSTHAPLRLEALAACGLLYREAGLPAPALDYVHQLKEEATQGQLGDWKYLAETLAQDFVAYMRILSSPRLADHVFWQGGQVLKAAACPAARPPSVPGLQTVLDDRRLHLSRLLLLSDPACVSRDFGPDALTGAHARQRRSHRTWNDRMQRQEMALAAMAGGHWARAAKLLEGVAATRPTARGACAVTGVFQPAKLELMYGLAKVRMEQGAMLEGRNLYTRYLHSAMEAVRGFTSALSQLRERELQDVRPPTASPGAASAASMLPPRYRHAYDYLQANYSRADLSVHEVAASIGVSNRALQMQFKRSLGVTPSELMRTLRLAATNAAATLEADK